MQQHGVPLPFSSLDKPVAVVALDLLCVQIFVVHSRGASPPLFPHPRLNVPGRAARLLGLIIDVLSHAVIVLRILSIIIWKGEARAS